MKYIKLSSDSILIGLLLILITAKISKAQNYHAIGYHCEPSFDLRDVPFGPDNLIDQKLFELNPVVIDYENSEVYELDKNDTENLLKKYLTYDSSIFYHNGDIAYFEGNYFKYNEEKDDSQDENLENEESTSSQGIKNLGEEWEILEIDFSEIIELKPTDSWSSEPASAPFNFSNFKTAYHFVVKPDGDEILFLNIYRSEDFYEYNQSSLTKENYLYSIPWINIVNYVHHSQPSIVNIQEGEIKDEYSLLNEFLSVEYYEELAFTFPGGIESEMIDADHPDLIDDDFDGYTSFVEVEFDYRLDGKTKEVQIYKEGEKWKLYNLNNYNELHQTHQFKYFSQFLNSRINCTTLETFKAVDYKGKEAKIPELEEVYAVTYEKPISSEVSSSQLDDLKSKILNYGLTGDTEIMDYDFKAISTQEFREKSENPELNQLFDTDESSDSDAGWGDSGGGDEANNEICDWKSIVEKKIEVSSGWGGQTTSSVQICKYVSFGEHIYEFLLFKEKYGGWGDENQWEALLPQFKTEPGSDDEIWRKIDKYWDASQVDLALIKSYSFNPKGDFQKEETIGIALYRSGEKTENGVKQFMGAFSLNDLKKIKRKLDINFKDLKKMPSTPSSGYLSAEHPYE